MRYMFVMLATLALASSGACLGYLAGYYNLRFFVGILLVSTVLLSVFFMISSTG